MSTRRKLEALRNLAERPGTEAEGKLAREILDRLESRRFPDKADWERPHWMAFEDYLRGDISTDDFIESMRRRVQWENAQPLPSTWVCACGNVILIGTKCENAMGHLVIQQGIRERFTKGDRVFYNRWAYPANCPATVAGYVRLRDSNNDHPWAWITLKFEHLKNNRQVPIYSAVGWHLSKEPVGVDQARILAGPR